MTQTVSSTEAEMSETDPTSTDTQVPAPASANSAAWNERISAFAAAVGKTPDEITLALKDLVGETNDTGLAVLSSPQALTDEDLKQALVGNNGVGGGPWPHIALGLFRLNLPKLRGPQQQVAAPSNGSHGTPVSLGGDVLPTVPEDGSFLEMLKVGGVLKVGRTEVMAGMKAALASALGLYNLPDLIVEQMELFATEQEEPLTEAFYRLQKQVTRRNYGEILSAIGVDGHFVSERRKKQLLDRLNGEFWTALRDFWSQLLGWQTAWQGNVANPGMLMAAFVAMAQGGAGQAMLPPGMNQPPDTASIRDAAETFVNKVNRVFAGAGIPVARALAWDATCIKNVLEEPGLPATLGATNKDQMLKTLGVSVGAEHVRLERSMTKFALSVMELPNVGSGNSELAYLAALINLGASIPWNKLPGGAVHETQPVGRAAGRGAARGASRGYNNGLEEDNG